MPDLTPEEEQVRRLLAGARHTDPMPTDVADRLDRVLADLAAEAPPDAAAPVDLAARRRRRTFAARILVAAAAVVVLGVGISRIDLGSSGDADSGSAADSAGSAESDAGGQAEKAPDSSLRALASGPVRLDSGRFPRQVRQLLGGVPADLFRQQGAKADVPNADTSVPAPVCRNPAWGRGTRIAAQYDGQPAALVVRPDADGRRTVDLFLCGEDRPTRSVTVPSS
jgi:hypothetical protein